MASDRQVAANRINAKRSTGPRTTDGKLRSRQNAYRHGLTAETVINSLEEARDYQTLEARILKDHTPETVLERELIARLASLLWRLRRATLIETGFFEVQGRMVQQRHQDQLSHEAADPALQIFYNLLHDLRAPPRESPSGSRDISTVPSVCVDPTDPSSEPRRKIDMTAAYLSACRAHSGAIKRLGRYETALWRQVVQTLLVLDTARRNNLPMAKIIARSARI